MGIIWYYSVKGVKGLFGFVTASMGELTKEQKQRYNAVYCGICRQIRLRSSSLARLGLSYDMVFLALLHMSLYEPEEACGKRACGLHPLRPRPWIDNEYIAYCADMNVALAHYSFLDDYADDGSHSAVCKRAHGIVVAVHALTHDGNKYRICIRLS